MPPVSIPEPVPSDLESPVPSAGSPAIPGGDMNSFFKSVAEQNNEKQAASPHPDDMAGYFQSIAGPQSDPKVNNSLPSAGNIPGGLFDDIDKQPKTGSFTGDVKAAASTTAQNIRDVGVNFLANLKKSPEDALKVWKDAVGSDNAVLKRGKVYFRWDSKDEFRPVSKGMFDGMANFISQHSRAAAFGAGALLTDGAIGALGAGGEAAAAGAAGLSEGAGAAAPAAAEAATGIGAKIAANFTPSAIGNAAAVGAGGGAAAPLLSSAIQNATGQESAPSAGQTALETIGGAAEGSLDNTLAHGAVGVAGPIAGSLFDRARSFIPETTTSLWSRTEDLYNDLKQTFKQSGMQLAPNGSSFELGKALGGDVYPTYEAGVKQNPGAFESLRKNLSQNIGVFVKQADEAAEASGKKFSVADPLQKVRALMEKGGIRFEENTSSVPRSPSSEMSYSDVAEDAPQQVTTHFAIMPRAKNVADNPYAFGETNPSNIKFLVDFYNRAAAKEAAGGFSPSEVTDMEQALGNKVYSKDSPPATRLGALMTQGSRLFSDRQKDIVKEAIGDPQVNNLVDAAYQDYSSKINPLRQFVQNFQSTGAASVFADRLIQPNNVEDVKALSNLLSKEYPDIWAQVKGNWLANEITKASDQNILDPGKLSSALFGGKGSKGYDPEILDTVFPGIQQTNLKTALRSLSKIDQTRFLNTPDQEQFLRQSFQTLLPFARGYHAIRATESLMGMLSDNGPVADYMAGPGLLKMASDADSTAEKAQLIGYSDAAKQFLAGMKKVFDPKVGYKYVPPAVASMMQGQKSEKPATLGNVYGGK